MSPIYRAEPDEPLSGQTSLTGRQCLELFEAQVTSRHLDLAARRLRAAGLGYYTIASAGHEGNAAVAAALAPTDPALLHYRSGAFYVARAAQVPGSTPVRDVLLGICAAAEEPMAGGRHKVFGNASLAIIPQTSTIASHLPRAVGLAFAVDRSHRIGLDCPWPSDAVVVCSFGDASCNHASALAAFNAAAHSDFQHLPVPVLFVCEDNGLGISVTTPPGWIEARHKNWPGLKYFAADGCDVIETYEAARRAAAWVRSMRRPAFLHLSVVRLLGHAGTDVETAYRKPADIARDLGRDPLLATARTLIESSQLSTDEVEERYVGIRDMVDREAAVASTARQLNTAEDIVRPLAPRRPEAVCDEVTRAPDPAARLVAFRGRLPEAEGPLTLAEGIRSALLDAALTYPNLIIFGEDVARKGGVYGVTRGLLNALGHRRVFDTLLDEQSILGLALGAGLAGLLPIPEVQYLAYVHNAEDQLRGEAATQQFFSQGQYRNPLVVRIAGLAYQKGFGGHFHNDNSLAVFRDVPGLVLAVPARADDAAAMLRTCIASAAVDGSVCAFVEPIALYHTRDLYEAGDNGWLANYPAPAVSADAHVPIGSARVYGDGDDLTIVTFGNGLRMSLRVAARVAAHDVRIRVLDLRWLSPLPLDDMLREASATGRVLIVDESRESGSTSEGIISALVDAGYTGNLRRVTSRDSFIPLGDAAEAVLVSEADIEKAALELVAKPR
jgi:2-oxoisovalerate dehydrogenase E1 component